MGNILLHAEPSTLPLVVVSDREATDIEVARAQIKLTDRIQYRRRLEFGELVGLHLANPPVTFHNVQYRLVHQGAAIDIALHVALTRQASNGGDHGLCQRLPLFPVRKVVIRAGTLSLFCHRGPLYGYLTAICCGGGPSSRSASERRHGGPYYQICSAIEATLIAQFQWLHRKRRPTLGPEMLYCALNNHA